MRKIVKEEILKALDDIKKLAEEGNIMMLFVGVSAPDANLCGINLQYFGVDEIDKDTIYAMTMGEESWHLECATKRL